MKMRFTSLSSARMRCAVSIPSKRYKLVAAVAAGDCDTAGLILHGLRGSAGHLDEAALLRLCAELEQAADACDLPQLRAGLPRLHALLAVLSGALSGAPGQG